MSKICTTKNYKLFTRSAENRPTDLRKRRLLVRSMEKHGFLPEFPIIVDRAGGKYVIWDGQHRFAAAETLGLPVYWVPKTADCDVAEINATITKWQVADYAQRFAMAGNDQYKEVLEFSARHSMSVSASASLLAGTATFSNVRASFQDGTYEISERAWAEDVAAIWRPFTIANRCVKNSRFLEACMAVCRVSYLEPTRLLGGLQRCRDKLVSYSTRDAYLTMLEEIYNFGRKTMAPLRVDALNAMKDRDPVFNPEVRAAAKAKELATRRRRRTA